MNRPLISDVIAVIAEWFNLSVDDLTGPDRRQHISWPRHLAVYLSHAMTGQSLTGIGRVLGGRDHSTIWHSIGVVGRDLNGDPQLARAVLQLELAILERAQSRFCAMTILREHRSGQGNKAAAHG